MKQIIAVLTLVFLFFGCAGKPTVELKLPKNNQSVKKVEKKKADKVDNITVVEEFKPIEIKETDKNGSIINNKVDELKEDIIKEDLPTIDEGVNTPTVEPISLNKENKEDIQIEDKSIEVDSSGVKTKIAFVFTPAVANYARTSISTISGYLSYKKADYELIVYEAKNESNESISSTFAKIKSDNIKNVIAMFTPNAIGSLNNIVTSDNKVYLPLIEKTSSSSNQNLIFGSISYDDQIRKLISYSDSNNAMFYQESYLGSKLKRTYETLVDNVRVKKEISKNENNFKSIAGDSRLNDSTLFLTTDVVKTSLLLSQLRAYDVSPKVIFSTQANYDPMIMTLTQEKDRENFVVANSIDSVNQDLREEIATFGGNIHYQWVDYSTLVGINYLYSGNNSSLIKTKIVDNKVEYNPKLFKSTEVGFLEIK